VNIFYISEDPFEAAQMMVDKHVVKMILESAQLLSTAHRLLDGEEYVGQSLSGRKAKRWRLPDERDSNIYQATHINHPSAVWCRESSENYYWLFRHFAALMAEYTYRYGKKHKCDGPLSVSLMQAPLKITKGKLTKMPSAMDDQYKISDDPLTNYRNYYKIGKSRMHRWTKRQPPEWIAA